MNQRDYNQQIEDLLNVLDDLITLNSTAPVLVEGDHDISSLRDLGLRGAIFKLNTGSSVFNTCDALSRNNREIIVLTDWDRKGGTLAKLVRNAFVSCGVRPNLDIRARLAGLCKKDIKDVESLATYIAGLQRKVERESSIKKNIERTQKIRQAKQSG